MILFLKFKLYFMVAFGFYIDKKLLNESCGLRDAELGVDMQISLESWNPFETKTV